MGRVLIDNWSLENAAKSIRNTYYFGESPDESYMELLEAIILWDDLIYIDGYYSEGWKSTLHEFGYNKFLKSIELDEIKKIEKKEREINQYIDSLNVEGIVQRGAIEYLYKSNLLEANYLPAIERADFLIKNHNFENYITRKSLIESVEKNLDEFYEDINRLTGKKSIQFDRPVLTDFVINNTKDSKSFIETAMQIRNEKEVIQFRKWMEQFDTIVNTGNSLELKKHLHFVDEIVRDVTRISDSRIKGKIQISFVPSIEATFGISKMSKIKRNMSFLRTLTKQAVKERTFNESSRLFKK